MAKVEQSYEAHTKAINAYGAIVSAEIHYIVFEARDEEDALQAVFGVAEREVGMATLTRIEIESRENHETYKVRAEYEISSESGGDSSNNVEKQETTISFDCGGGTKHINYAIVQTEHRYKYYPGQVDIGKAINWNGKVGPESEIAGIDIPTAQLRESYTRYMKPSQLTTSFRKKVARLVGKVNNGSFKGWDAGEVMFLGMSFSGAEKGPDKIAVTFNFAIQLNEELAEIAGKKFKDKQGFDYAWVLHNSEVTKDGVKVDIEAIYAARVCERASFRDLGL